MKPKQFISAEYIQGGILAVIYIVIAYLVLANLGGDAAVFLIPFLIGIPFAYYFISRTSRTRALGFICGLCMLPIGFGLLIIELIIHPPAE